ncbi:HupE/UreJ family protein [Frigidibacter sp. MR17.24]|uniref:HupE/UreJ family protein n=1 Tax=Frigidibacter sp. MR17.24 TaxID=3127345 RepID=UPI0030130982
MKSTMNRLMLAAGLATLAGPALAHPGHGGLVSGVMHPLMGADHLLAMVAVGLWAGVTGRPAAVATFLAAMAAGAGLGLAGVSLPLVEPAILASVVVFGLAVAMARAGSAAALGAVALFALAHGQAHAAEATGATGLFLAGMLAATAALHLAGYALAARLAGNRVAQGLIGGGVALSGLWLALG